MPLVMVEPHVFPFFNLVGHNEAQRQEAQANQATPPRDVEEEEPASTSGKVTSTTFSVNIDIGIQSFNTCFGSTFQEEIGLVRDWTRIVPSSSSARFSPAGPKSRTYVWPAVKYATKQRRWNGSLKILLMFWGGFNFWCIFFFP